MIELELCPISARARSAVPILLLLLAGCGTSTATPTADVPSSSTPGETHAVVADPAAHAHVPTVLTAAPSTAGKKLSGRITFAGTAPQRKPIDMSKDALCVKLHDGKPVLDEDLLVDADGGVQNVFVYIRRGVPKGDYPIPTEPARLDQKDCMYRPRVQGLRVGQKLLVGNGDPVTHNVRSFPIKSRPFNFGQPPGSEPRERIFEGAEREVEVQCDIHPWMHAYLFIMDHPFYAVTAADGTYAIDNLPPGEYTLAAWHEKLGRDQQTVTVSEADLADVNFSYKPK